MIGAYFGLDVFDLLILKVALVAIVAIVVTLAVILFGFVLVAVQIAVWFAVHGVVFALWSALVVVPVLFRVLRFRQLFTADRANDPALRSGLADRLTASLEPLVGFLGVLLDLRHETLALMVLAGVKDAVAAKA